MEYFNEACILLSMYHYFLFTDFVADPAMRYTMGEALLYITLFNILVNVLNLMKVVAVIYLHKLKKLRWKIRCYLW